MPGETPEKGDKGKQEYIVGSQQGTAHSSLNELEFPILCLLNCGPVKATRSATTTSAPS